MRQISEQISEQILRAAAERLVARGNASAVVLNGSRARGDAAETSDWDVCLVGDPLRGKARAPWNDARIEPVRTRRCRARSSSRSPSTSRG